MKKQSYIYIITNQNGTTLYTGVTSDLKKRMHQHKNKEMKGFSEKYNLNKLIYYEIFDNIEEAIAREKQIKKYRRDKKINLINQVNLDWLDLCEEIL